MKDADRQRIERYLGEFDEWRASGLPLKVYVQQRGEELAHWRARLSWEGRWREMLAGTYTKPARPSGTDFVRAVRNFDGAAVGAPTEPESTRQDCLRIALSTPTGALQASVEWPLNQIGASSAWLREVLA